MEVFLCYHPEILSESALHTLEGTLSPSDQQRTLSFIKESVRTSFVLSRCLRNFALKGVLQDSELGKNKYGKPFLLDHPTLHFNVSHSRGIAGIAVSDQKCGLDVEMVRESYILQGFERIFSEEEREILSRSDALMTTRFWTLKEAWAKCLGTGLSSSFSQCQINYDPLTDHCGVVDRERPSLKSHQILNGDFVIATVGLVVPKSVRIVTWKELLNFCV